MSPDVGLESVEHDPQEDEYRVTYHRETPPSVAVPAAMQEIAGKEMWELDPLHAVLDTEALDELFQPPRDAADRRPVRVTFTYQNQTVTVCSGRRIVVRDPNDQNLDSSPNP